MRFLRYTLLLLSALCLLPAAAKKEMKTTYMFGFAASFNDSTVYVTDIQKVDSAFFDSKTNFLVSRDNYSYQLRDYLAEQGYKNRTCFVTYANSKEKAEKKFNKLVNKYSRAGKKKTSVHFFQSKKKKNAELNTMNDELRRFDIKYLNETEFAFKPIIPFEDDAQ